MSYLLLSVARSAAVALLQETKSLEDIRFLRNQKNLAISCRREVLDPGSVEVLHFALIDNAVGLALKYPLSGHSPLLSETCSFNFHAALFQKLPLLIFSQIRIRFG